MNATSVASAAEACLFFQTRFDAVATSLCDVPWILPFSLAASVGHARTGTSHRDVATISQVRT